MDNAITEHDTIALDALLEKVYQDSGHDFREYKRSTVTRRLERRLYDTGTRTYLDYMRFLDAHPEEYQRLTDYLTIIVSDFFRNPYTFQQITSRVLPELESHKNGQGKHSLRFWSTACARGEEAYSIAIMLSEYLGHRLPAFDISIYATDVSPQALKEARAGIYAPKDTEGLSPSALGSYFIHTDEGHVVRPDIRQMVSFSQFDLTSTTKPPFLDLDCIFCCNILIYLQRHLQERVLSMVYDTLATPGYLILGEAETLPSSLREKLECLDSKAKIYKKDRRRKVHD
mgnify:CR=1 FL=1